MPKYLIQRHVAPCQSGLFRLETHWQLCTARHLDPRILCRCGVRVGGILRRKFISRGMTVEQNVEHYVERDVDL